MAINQRASGLFVYAQSLIDRVVSPQTRQQYYKQISSFAHKQPIFFTFLLLQLLFSFTPLAIFLSFVLGTLILSLITAILFSLFWTGVALLILVPTLFITVSLGLLVWIWAVSSFVAARWVYNLVPARELGLTNGKKIVVEKRGEGYNGVDGA